MAVKATAAAIKATIAAIKGLIALIAAGGWVAVVIILLICLIALIVGSCFGLFFGSDSTGTGTSVTQAVSTLNGEYLAHIQEIEDANPHDRMETTSNDGKLSINYPEIPVDIVNLGLIYDVTVIELENGLHHVAVKMTLTAPGCGMGPHLVMEAKDRIEALEGVEAADVEMVWDPPWNQDMVSEEGRMKLGLI